MLKKYIAIFLLCISNFILIGHSIIPHNHIITRDKKEHEHLNAHGHNHHHHHHHTLPNHSEDKKNEDKSNGLSDLFAFVSHSSDYIKGEEQVLQQGDSVIKEILLTEEYRFNINAPEFNSELKSHKILYRDPDYCPPPNAHIGLRGPPLFFS